MDLVHLQNATFFALQPEGLSQVADLVSFYKENANILREVRDAPLNDGYAPPCHTLSMDAGWTPDV
jgi:hypothetical protein